MRAIITVIGKDTVGILSKVSTVCAQYGVNILEVTQSVLQELFAMIMLVNVDKSSISFDEFKQKLDLAAELSNTKIHVMHEDIFNSMHRI